MLEPRPLVSVVSRFSEPLIRRAAYIQRLYSEPPTYGPIGEALMVLSATLASRLYAEPLIVS